MELVLKTEDVVKKYLGKTVLNKINMTVNKGDIYGFIGKNGAGKTTLMKVILSLTKANRGSVSFWDNKSIDEVGLKVGSLIEAPGFYKNETAYENLKRFSILYGCDESKIEGILKTVGLSDTGKKKVKDFSLGMKQRLGIGIALLNDPEFLILDEPINGLDPEGIKEIRDIIIKLNKEKNITFLISSHLLDELSKIATKYGIINEGVLVEEISASELKEKCKSKLIVECDDKKLAKELLSKMINEEKIIVNKTNIEIHDLKIKPSIINKELVSNGVLVDFIYNSSDSLEEYFLQRMGN
jgi:ABC-2 type transport system ATP-binding protein